MTVLILIGSVLVAAQVVALSFLVGDAIRRERTGAIVQPHSRAHAWHWLSPGGHGGRPIA